MKNKLNARTVVLIIMCVALGGLFVKNGLESKQVQKSTVEQTVKKPTVNITINDGASLIAESVSAGTPFEALSLVAEKKQISLITKQYDFGIFVSGVGDAVTTNDFGWIYYVNNMSGDVAADKYELKDGDQVEWKFEKSIF
ncbi:MAG: DUF4430 domain-containing protein [Candidatus Gottesmanbacteria bacterium]